MLVEMDSSMLSALIRGSDPAYEIMDHPLIKSKGYYVGGHNDKWVWNSHFSGTEQQLWETYQLLKNLNQYVNKHLPCTLDNLYAKLYAINGVEWVYIKDNNDLSVEITVEGGDDADIAEVLHDNLMICVRTVGDYRVEKVYPSHTAGYNIYRKSK
jgi:hypothetical protein